MQASALHVLFVGVTCVCAGVTTAASSEHLVNKQLLGMRYFNQSCRVCHSKPQLTSSQYGPVLSKDSLGGDEAALRSFVSDGTPRMPGFKYTYTPEQIDEIIAYIKTIPTP